MIKRSIHQEENSETISSNRIASKYTKQKLIDLKGKTDKSIIIVGNVKTPLCHQ